MAAPLRELAEYGQSPWIDYIARPFLRDGELEELVRQGITGVTSNPTIFSAAIAGGDAYDQQMREVLARQHDPREIFLELAQEDIRDACDALRPVFDLSTDLELSNRTQDGWVSLEVDPNLAGNAAETVRQAKRLYRAVDRPNLFVKIPGTEPGLQAIEDAIACGIPVNVTLLFSLERHRAAARAYIRGLRRLRDAGGDLSRVASVASFFVSRVDTEADRRLDELGGHEELKGQLAIANAKLAYQSYLELFNGSDWRELELAGASPQRCLWASTSTKNDAYRDVLYVEELIGAGTVNTMPPETIRAFQDHGRVEPTLVQGVEDARRILEAFADAGIDYTDVVDVLEREGLEKFAASFTELIDNVADKCEALPAT